MSKLRIEEKRKEINFYLGKLSAKELDTVRTVVLALYKNMA